jgi:2-dehydropantoate 2-reductase
MFALIFKGVTMSDHSFNKVSVIGAGAMGACYASRFFEMGGVDVALLARGDRCERLRGLGLIVNGKPYAIPVNRPEEATPADL